MYGIILANITNTQIYAIIVMVAVSLAIVALLFCGGEIFFKGIQQRGYHATGYLNWISRSNNRFMYRLTNVCLFSMVAYITFSVIFAPFSGQMFSYFGLIFFYVFTMVFFKTNQLVKTKQRQSVDYTARLTRLVVTFCVLTFLLSFGTILSMNYLDQITTWELFPYIRYMLVCIFPLLLPFIVLLANAINSPFEKMNIARYGRKARKILEKNKVKVVAVTGSYGKTTTKDLIASLLGEKYIVAAAPKSFNTPSGVAMTVQNLVTEQTDFAVLEMGARKVGEIAYLARIAPPDYSVITSVGRMHLESFKKYENIVKTKYEIVENTNEGGICFFNCADVGAKELYNKATRKKYCSGDTDGDLNFKVNKVDKDGSEFTVQIDGKKHVFKTKLLGHHNVSNVAMAILVAYKLGVEMEILKPAVERLEATDHRLKMIKNDQSIVIDDSYNSNLKGVRYAADVLSMFEGRKICVTPGLVEMGKLEDEANREVGKILGAVCDKVILVGNMRSIPITEGLKEVGFDFDNLLVFENMIDATNSLPAFMKKGDVVLFENDIPDSYL